MKLIKILSIITLCAITTQEALASSKSSSKAPQNGQTFSYRYDHSVRISRLRSESGNSDAGVRFELGKSFRMGNLNCISSDCYAFREFRDGSDLFIEVTFVSKSEKNTKVKRSVKVANIRGDGHLDFVVPVSVSLSDFKRPRLFCREISLPTMPSTNNCGGSPGIYTITVR